jgi:hypothetical protein
MAAADVVYPEGRRRICMRVLADTHYPDAERIRVVLDNLSAHSPSPLYQRFPLAQARRIILDEGPIFIDSAICTSPSKHLPCPSLKGSVQLRPALSSDNDPERSNAVKRGHDAQLELEE